MAGSQDTPSLLRKIFLSRFFLIGITVIALYTVCGFFLVPWLLKRQVTHYVADNLGHQIQINEVQFNPYNFTLNVHGLDLTETDGSAFLSFQRLLANFELKSLFRWAWTFDEIRLEAPSVRFDIDSRGEVNWARLTPPAPANQSGDPNVKSADPDEKTEDDAPPRLIFERIALVDGRFTFSDRSDPTPAEAIFEPITLEIDRLSTLAGETGTNTIVATSPEGGRLEWKGELSLNPISSRGEISITDFKPLVTWLFLQDELYLNPPKGNTQLRAEYIFGYEDQSVQLTVDPIEIQTTGFNLTLEDGESPMLALDEVQMSGGRFDLASREIGLGTIQLSGGNLRVARNQAGRINWQRIIEAGKDSASKLDKAATEAADPGTETSYRITLDQLAVNDVGVRYLDHSTPRPYGIDLERLGVELSSKFETGDFKGSIDEITIDAAGLSFKELARDETLLTLPEASVDGGRVDFTSREISVAEARFSQGRIDLWTDGEKGLNWIRIFSPASGNGQPVSEPAENGQAATGEAWTFQLADGRLDGFRLAFSDRNLAEPNLYALENMSLQVKNYGTAPQAEVGVDLKADVSPGGQLALNGVLRPTPMSAQAAFTLEKIALPPLEPYLQRVSTLRLPSGNVSADGDIRYGMPDTAVFQFQGTAGINDLHLDLPTSEKPLIAWKSMAAKGVTFGLSPNNLEMEELRIEKPVGELIVREDSTLNLADARLPDGSSNDKSDPEKAEPPAPAEGKSSDTGQDQMESSPPFPIKLKRVNLVDGKLDYADLSLIPQFAADITQLNGVIAGLSSDPDSRTVLELKGRVGPYGTADITGDLQPFHASSYSDVKMEFHNLEMTDLTPYSAKFAGRGIETGKMSANLEYKIRNNKVEGNNQLVMDSLVLGERIKNSQAPNLPLDLALALLRDRNNRIQLDLPVSGDLSDPEFSYSHIIWKALFNLITKIVTAPFQILGSLLGADSEGLDRIEFAAGSAMIPPPEAEKLVSLVKGLAERPQLKLEVQGQYHTELDGNALKTVTVIRAIATDLGYTVGPDEDPGPLDFSDPATREAIETLATERLGPETLDSLKGEYAPQSVDTPAPQQSAQETPQTPAAPDPPDLEKYYRELFTRVVEKEPLEEATLKALGQSRADAIVQELVAKSALDASRIVAAEPLAAEESATDEFVAAKLNLTANQ
jgi:uncharacterized protein involved in outer membrane biogenesis